MRKFSSKSLLFATVFFFVLYSCKEEKKDPPGKRDIVADKLNLKAGWDIVSTQCFSCHQPDPSSSSGIAPPMADIKTAYLGEGRTIEIFTKELDKFLQNPSAEISKMPDAVKKYGLMPKLSFSKEQVTEIAKYIYHTPIEDKSWFDSSYGKEAEKYAEIQVVKSPLETGRELAMKTKAVLGKNLLQAIKSGGASGAVDFCSTRAIFLTDSMATTLHTRIKRVSDKNRNPLNAANKDEAEYMEEVRKMIASGQTVSGKISENETHYTGYYPIMVDEMCLQCHGKRDAEILTETWKTIKGRYPEDKAYGYALNDLRGLWVVKFDKTK
jgi:mono/diheme cytochrome c family protein